MAEPVFKFDLGATGETPTRPVLSTIRPRPRSISVRHRES